MLPSNSFLASKQTDGLQPDSSAELSSAYASKVLAAERLLALAKLRVGASLSEGHRRGYTYKGRLTRPKIQKFL